MIDIRDTKAVKAYMKSVDRCDPKQVILASWLVVMNRMYWGKL